MKTFDEHVLTHAQRQIIRMAVVSYVDATPLARDLEFEAEDLIEVLNEEVHGPSTVTVRYDKTSEYHPTALVNSESSR